MDKNNLLLNDFNSWKEPNNEFLYTNYIGVHIQEKNIHPDFMVILAMLFSPEFIIVDNMIFWKGNFRKNYYDELVLNKSKNFEIELWMNFILISNFFPDDIEYEKHAKIFGEKIKENFELKLKCDFKDRQFKVIADIDEDDGAFLYFHQIFK